MPVIDQRASISLRKLLLATDFSPAAEKAASYALALARNFSSTVEVAHVFEPSIATTYEAVIGLPPYAMQQITEENLGRVRREFSSAGIEAHTAYIEGHRPYAGLLQLAKDHEVDLIVAGTRSKSGIERLILGSTAEELIRHSGCPVLTVGPNAAPVGNGPLVFRSIVYATDFSTEAAKAAFYALSFAQDSGAHLYFCYVLMQDAIGNRQHEYLNNGFKEALKKLIPNSSYDWCDPECAVEHGDASQAILHLADRVHADLIVLGARKASFWLIHIAPGITPSLLAEAACPIMTVC
jgi:nucleotide-binding universal stress UspA family protein